MPPESGWLCRGCVRRGVSKTEQPSVPSFGIFGPDLPHRGLGGNMLGYGLLGTIVVVLLIVFIVRAL
jgi:hypothetical protein